MLKFSSGLDLVFNCACFIYIGAWLPFDKFHISEIGVTPWRLVALMLVILTLRRIPSLLLLYKLIPEVKDLREALFCGYFGPVSALLFKLNITSNCALYFFIQIGVSAVFVSTLAQSRLNAPQDPPQSQEEVLATALQPIVAFVVLGSILTRTSSLFQTSLGNVCLCACLRDHTFSSDGLSIPFFSVGQCITRSIARRRAPPPDMEFTVAPP